MTNCLMDLELTMYMVYTDKGIVVLFPDDKEKIREAFRKGWDILPLFRVNASCPESYLLH